MNSVCVDVHDMFYIMRVHLCMPLHLCSIAGDDEVIGLSPSTVGQGRSPC